MLKLTHIGFVTAMIVVLQPISGVAQPLKEEPKSKVTAIPDSVIQRYKLDTTFYKKHLDYNGFSILSSAKVSDEALYEARYLIHKLLGEREDILNAMIKSGCRFMIMAPTEMTTDVPEQRHLRHVLLLVVVEQAGEDDRLAVPHRDAITDAARNV